MRDYYSTKQKELIKSVITGLQKEFTIKDVYNKLNGAVGLTTIYRLIDKMILEGSIYKRIENDGNTYYQYLEKCEEDNHFYLKCEKCKCVTHVDCDCIKELSSHIKKDHSFNINNNSILINGICNKCSKKVKKWNI